MYAPHRAESRVSIRHVSFHCCFECGRPDHAKTHPARKTLGRHHRKTIGRNGRCQDFRPRRQRRGCSLFHAGCRMHDVGRPQLGRRDAGPHLQPPFEKSHRHQRPGCRAHRSHARILQRKRIRIPSRLRSPRSGHARYARRPDDHAGRIRDDEPERSPPACHGNGRGISRRTGLRQERRAIQRQDQGMALLETGLPPPHRGRSRGAPRRGGLPPARSIQHPEAIGGSGTGGAVSGKES